LRRFSDWAASSFVVFFAYFFSHLKRQTCQFWMNPHLSYFFRSVCLRNRNALHNTFPFRIFKLYKAGYISLYILGLNCTVRRFLDTVLCTASITFELTHYIFYVEYCNLHPATAAGIEHIQKTHTYTAHCFKGWVLGLLRTARHGSLPPPPSRSAQSCFSKMGPGPSFPA
jgi:hypothetical protein